MTDHENDRTVTDKHFHLIEAAGSQYWNGRGVDFLAFESDIQRAVRFADEESACRVRVSLLDEPASRLSAVVQHAWIDPKE